MTNPFALPARPAAVQRVLTWLDSHVEHLFLFLAVGFGLLFIILIPPFKAPDEYGHLYRAWAVSEGSLFTSRYAIPRQFTEMVEDNGPMSIEQTLQLNQDMLRWRMVEPFRPGERVEASFSSAGVQPPLAYLPQALGLWVGRALGLALLPVYYSARLFNYLAWALLMFTALRLLPAFRWTFLLLAFLPMSLWQAASLSPDAFSNASAFLLTALVLRLASDQTRSIGRRELIWLSAAVAVVAWTKVPYALLALTVLLIPPEKFGDKARYRRILLLLFAMAAVLAILANVAPLLNVSALQETFPRAGRLRTRIRMMLFDPLDFPRRLWNSILGSPHPPLIPSYLGLLGWLDVWLPAWLYWLLGLSIPLSALSDASPRFNLRPVGRALLAGVAAAALLAICLLLYLSFTPIDFPMVIGVQGRYLIPFGPLLALVFYNQRLARWGQWVHALLAILIPSALLITAWVVARTYYGF